MIRRSGNVCRGQCSGFSTTLYAPGSPAACAAIRGRAISGSSSTQPPARPRARPGRAARDLMIWAPASSTRRSSGAPFFHPDSDLVGVLDREFPPWRQRFLGHPRLWSRPSCRRWPKIPRSTAGRVRCVRSAASDFDAGSPRDPGGRARHRRLRRARQPLTSPSPMAAASYRRCGARAARMPGAQAADTGRSDRSDQPASDRPPPLHRRPARPRSDHPHLGEIRLSGFLLWQSVHSEFYFTYLPGVSQDRFLRAIRSFQERQRR